MVELDARERRVVAAMWAFRARSENEAASRFVRIAARLERDSAPPAMVALAREAISDERRHRARCQALAERFGHGQQDLHERPVPEVAPADLSAERRLTWELVAFGCLTESINAALLMRSYQVTTEPESKEAMRTILADEVQHARLGWARLASVDDREWLAEHFARMLDATVPAELLDPRIQAEVSPTLRAHGVLARSELVELLRTTVEGVLVPGFSSFGVDSASIVAWLARALDQNQI